MISNEKLVIRYILRLFLFRISIDKLFLSHSIYLMSLFLITFLEIGRKDENDDITLTYRVDLIHRINNLFIRPY